jgi:hypothetical protein
VEFLSLEPAAKPGHTERLRKKILKFVRKEGRNYYEPSIRSAFTSFVPWYQPKRQMAIARKRRPPKENHTK